MAVTPIDEVDHGPDRPRLKLVGPAEPAPTTNEDPRLEPAAKAIMGHISALAAKVEEVANRRPSAEMLAVFQALAQALSLRVLLFIGFIAMAAGGAYVVADPTAVRITAFCLFGLIAYLPIVWLNTRKA